MTWSFVRRPQKASQWPIPIQLVASCRLLHPHPSCGAVVAEGVALAAAPVAGDGDDDATSWLYDLATVLLKVSCYRNSVLDRRLLGPYNKSGQPAAFGPH